MDAQALANIFGILLTALTFLIDFLKAIVIPVVPAGVIIAFIVDHLLKRLPFWQDGYAGVASLALNMLFSAGLFVAAQVGQSASYLEILVKAGVVLTLMLSITTGFLVSGKTHKEAMLAGVGKSVSEERFG